MTTVLRPTKPLANHLRQQAHDVARQLALTPKLQVILVGDNSASQTYVRAKKKAAETIGLACDITHLPAHTSAETVLQHIDTANNDAEVHGILLQLPLPEGLNKQPILDAIDPAKDVDGLCTTNVGRLHLGKPGLRPATPLGIIRLLQWAGLTLAGKRAVVVGRSGLVGWPMACMLQQHDCTVTNCHIETEDLAYHTKQAEILVSATGRIDLITEDMVSPNTVVIDVGTRHGDTDPRTGKRELRGDVHPDVANVASLLTPVPGGVGPMTVASLMTNLVDAACTQQSHPLHHWNLHP